LNNIKDKKFEFLNLIINSIVIEDEENNFSSINLEKYFKYRIFKNVSENIKNIFLRNFERNTYKVN